MATTFGARLMHAWNAFKQDPDRIMSGRYHDYGQSFMYRPDRLHLTRGPDKTIIASIYNRISMDVAAVKIEHVQLDEEDRYISTIKSPLNNCLTLEANIDQTGRTFIQDAVLTMLDSGCVALVPTETDVNPTSESGPSFDIMAIRAATIKQWYPRHVQIDIYNEETGQHSQYTLPKSMMAIVENPFYPVMNEPNSTMQRLIRKLSILDSVDDQIASDKLNMIIQLPYVIKTEERRKQAENRRKDLEQQLANSKYGIAYADGTEKIVQLNKPLDNSLLSQIEYLTSMLYSQLGLTTGILDGTADENTMLNYNNRVVEPILSVLTDEMKRKFLTKNARTRGQSIKFFIQPFRALPISNVAELANSLARNEIVTPNEFRQILGMKPAPEPQADQLHNANMPGGEQGQIENQSDQELNEILSTLEEESGGGDAQADAENINAQLDELEEMLNHDDPDKINVLKHYLPTPAQYASKYYDPEKAHEYYMKNRELKKRKSMSSLNEKGLEVAEYVKKKIDEEKQGELDKETSRFERALSTLKSNKQADTDENAEYTNQQLKSARDAKDSIMEDINSQAAKTTEAINRRAEQDTKSARSQRDSAVKQSTARMQSEIDMLRDRLANMTPVQKQKNQNKFQAIIDSIREENDANVAKLNSAYEKESASITQTKKSDTDKVKAGKKSDASHVKTAYEATTANIRANRKEIQRVINDNFKKSVSELRAETKGNKGVIGEKYTEKWLKELDRIKGISEYLKPPKSKSGRKSSGKTKKGEYRPFWWL